MKIGIDCHNLEGKRTGTARYLMNLLKYWAKENTNFVLYFKNQISDDISKGQNFQTRILNSNSNFWFEHILLPKVIKKDGVEIFFSPFYILPIRIPKGIKTAVAIHDISYEAHSKWYSWQNRILLKWISKKSAKKADIIFTCSEFTKNEILKYYHRSCGASKLNPEKIFVIPLAVDEKFKVIEDKTVLERIKSKYNIKNKFIFYVGAIFNRRFVPETIKAFAKIADKLPNYQLLIGGPNYTYPHIDIKSEDSIIYNNYIDEEDLVYLYNSADLFVWLSKYEGFGLPPLEAMACGTPVITTKMGSLLETVGNAALFVENPENIDEISEKILKVLKDENLRNELIKKGLERAQKFSWKKTAKETLNILLQDESK